MDPKRFGTWKLSRCVQCTLRNIMSSFSFHDQKHSLNATRSFISDSWRKEINTRPKQKTFHKRDTCSKYRRQETIQRIATVGFDTSNLKYPQPHMSQTCCTVYERYVAWKMSSKGVENMGRIYMTNNRLVSMGWEDES